MDWEKIYRTMQEETYLNKKITRNKTIKEIFGLSEDIREEIISYHNYRVKIIKTKKGDSLIFNKIISDDTQLKEFHKKYNQLSSYKAARRNIIKFLKYGEDEIADSQNIVSYLRNYIKTLNLATKYVEISISHYLLDYLYYNDYVNDKINVLEIIENDSVPSWHGYYPDIKYATNSQVSFYKNWKENFVKGNYIDIEGEISYIFVFMYELVEKFINDRNISYLEQNFFNIKENYGKYKKIQTYIYSWLSDAYLAMEDYDKSWDFYLLAKNQWKTQKIKINDILGIKFNSSNKSLSGAELLKITGEGLLSKVGKSNIKDIEMLADIYLQDFKEEHGTDILNYFLGRFGYWNLTKNDFKKLESYYNDLDEFNNWKEKYIYLQNGRSERLEEFHKYDNKLYHPDRKGLFAGHPGESRLSIIMPYYHPLITKALVYKLLSITREVENTFREEAGIPKIGEGWVSETELFYKLKKYFPNEKIVHHGRPKWLGRQHLDIFFPNKNIAIEYQGLQHSKPIDFFGGKEQFEKQKKRDQKKKNKCNKHDCHLIYVYPNYDFYEICENIKSYL